MGEAASEVGGRASADADVRRSVRAPATPSGHPRACATRRPRGPRQSCAHLSCFGVRLRLSVLSSDQQQEPVAAIEPVWRAHPKPVQAQARESPQRHVVVRWALRFGRCLRRLGRSRRHSLRRLRVEVRAVLARVRVAFVPGQKPAIARAAVGHVALIAKQVPSGRVVRAAARKAPLILVGHSGRVPPGPRAVYRRSGK